jgi:transcription elongation GreA/GreB family factor
LDVLSAVLDASEKVDEPDRAVIGRRVTLLEEEGHSVTYALVFPGDGDPVQGWIGADSPLGAAVMGCTPGDTAEVDAPVGRRVVTVLSVE